MRGLFLLVVLASVGAGGYLAARWQFEDGPEVTVREGAPALEDGVDAVLIVDTALIERAVAAEIERAAVPGDLRNVQVEAVAEGLRITGTVSLGIPGGGAANATFATTAVPGVSSDGAVAVDLTGTSVGELPVPAELEGVLGPLVSREVSARLDLAQYRVRRIETSASQFFVYFSEREASAP